MIELSITQDEWPTEQQADGMVVQWKASEGDTVEQGQVIVEIVIVKTTMEVPSPANGVIREICVTKDKLFKPGTVLARIEEAD
ncbi:MAG: Dihydrolipoyllysine-residue acetyltransferase component of pyruvate dehydrogenase complex [Deltaproteobacteria bacterium]|jgi:pyruvate/2-oxoglutarate dehydrogenase complex dihydrolipoamide acyltransferase (E2) component|nr:Dihydrolipoyllysine-residue acetyltransferase component of pyruvate dehydrogenase complex [Deltaproteobacteria bacterium]